MAIETLGPTDRLPSVPFAILSAAPNWLHPSSRWTTTNTLTMKNLIESLPTKRYVTHFRALYTTARSHVIRCDLFTAFDSADTVW